MSSYPVLLVRGLALGYLYDWHFSQATGFTLIIEWKLLWFIWLPVSNQKVTGRTLFVKP